MQRAGHTVGSKRPLAQARKTGNEETDLNDENGAEGQGSRPKKKNKGEELKRRGEVKEKRTKKGSRGLGHKNPSI